MSIAEPREMAVLCRRFFDYVKIMSKFTLTLTTCIALLAGVSLCANAQERAADSIFMSERKSKLSVGGYGEVAYSRHFYSDNLYRYKNVSAYKDDPSNGQFDIPHAVIYLGYDFGKGWTLGTEIEFEHTGTGAATEIDTDEGGEYEIENEKGGEVELEQFWINKEFAPWANIKLGHILVPVGLNNAYHEPLNFFTVYRPEGEDCILPSTWHDTGVSLWGNYGKWRYELMMVAGLNALQYTRDGWIHDGAGSAWEFKPANKYGFAFRVDYYAMPGLRLGLSGYYGQAMHNSSPNDLENSTNYGSVKCHTYVGSFDFTFKKYNWIVRGQADYGYVSDTPKLNSAKSTYASTAPYDVTRVGKNAVAIGIEAGYNLFALFNKTRDQEHKLYLFGRFDFYDSQITAAGVASNDYTRKRVWTGGINYYPIKQIVLKADYSYRKLDHYYTNEPSINIGVAYEGWFL